MKEQYLKVDDRNRVSLAKVSKTLSSHYRAYTEGDKIILEPIIVEIPKEERWLHEPKNKQLLHDLKKAMSQKTELTNWDDLKELFKDIDLDSNED